MVYPSLPHLDILTLALMLRKTAFTIVFAGKDASRALAQSSLKPEECRAEWQDLGDKEKTTLNEWFTFFSKRYNIVGTVAGASNL